MSTSYSVPSLCDPFACFFASHAVKVGAMPCNFHSFSQFEVGTDSGLLVISNVSGKT